MYDKPLLKSWHLIYSSPILSIGTSYETYNIIKGMQNAYL